MWRGEREEKERRRGWISFCFTIIQRGTLFFPLKATTIRKNKYQSEKNQQQEGRGKIKREGEGRGRSLFTGQ